jgi:hypothetical protein
LFLTAANAQTFTARITGVVKDSSESVVPGATVTATAVNTNTKRGVTTGAEGQYNLQPLLPGEFDVLVEAAGFQPQVRRGVRLETNQTATLDFTLAVAQAATTLDVTAELPLLQSATSGMGTTLENKLIEQYPLPQRDVMGLVRSLPGVIAGGQVGDARGGRNVFDSTFSVAGGRSSTKEVLLDGAANTIGDFNGVVIVPPQDSVQEFRVETSRYSAEFGRSGGGTVNIVTKSGTNRFHGGTYYYHQNNWLNANSFGNNRLGKRADSPALDVAPRPIVRRNQYGGTVGGPLLIPRFYNGKDRTFFFASFEGRRERDPNQGEYSLPTALEMQGDFSKTVTIVGGQPQVIQVFDPWTSRLESGRYIRQPFPGNAIPASRFSPIAQNVLKLYPQPNRPGHPVTGRQNYWFQDTTRYSRDVFTARVDHNFSSRHRFFGRLGRQESLTALPSTLVRFTDTLNTYDKFYNVGLDDTYSITTNLVSVFRYSYVRFAASLVPNGTLGYDPTQLGFPNYVRDSANVLIAPNISFGFVDFGDRAYNRQPRDTQGFQEQLLWNKGRHNLRLGGEYRLYRFYPYQVFNPTGSYAFGQGVTQRDALAAATPTQGSGLASLLLGTGSFSHSRLNPLTVAHHYVSAYVQDDWKITSRLTLNLGLRWETETGTAEAHDRLSYFDPNFAAPVSGSPKGALLFAGGNNPRSIREANLKNFGPRVGAAYRLTGKMSARAAYGIFYLPLGVETDVVTAPFNFSVSNDIYNPDYTPKTTLANPFPQGIVTPASANRVTDGSYRLGLDANLVQRRQPAPYIQQWNVGVSRQIGRTMVVDASYYGSRGVHLYIPNLNLNQLDPAWLSKGGAYLTELVPNPFYGQLPASPLLARATIPRMQLLKPYPQFAAPTSANAFGGGLTYFRPPVGDSSYHAVTFKLERRFAAGLSLNAHYTVSKLIDIGGVGNGAAFTDVSGLRDIYNIRLERSVSGWDVPQRLVVNWAYELPFGKDRKLLGRSGWTDRLAGGWTLFAVHDGESGRPIAVGATDLSRTGNGASRATVVYGEQPKIDYGLARANARNWSPVCRCSQPWFNTKAFATTPEFVLPNGPRFVPNVRTDTVKDMSFSVTKKVMLREGLNFVVSANFFNFLNQVYFGGPDGSVTSTTFGSAGPAAGPRRIEVGAKFNF